MKSIKNIFGLMAASLMLLLGSCSSENEIVDSPVTPDKGAEKVGAISFSLGGSIGDAILTRADGTTEGEGTTEEYQTADEKKVTSLLAVIFTDADGGTATGLNDADTGKEDNNDVLYKVTEVQNPTVEFSGQKEYTEECENGHYQICFVANAGDNLKKLIMGTDGATKLTAETSTVADFKKLVQEQAPDNASFAMTSEFYTAHVANNVAQLGTVNLVRMMARVDIVNKADGVTITKATFKNRAVKSVLIRDDASSYTFSDYSEGSEKVYDNLSLVGSSATDAADNAYTAQIYSYEQYAIDEGEIPSITLTYTIDSKEYSHKIKFSSYKEKNESGANTETAMTIKRNYLYRINVTNSQNKLRFTIKVADWNSGETFVVTPEELLTNAGVDETPTDPTKTEPQLGYLMLADGTFADPTYYDASSATNKAIGVVAYLYGDDTPANQKVTFGTNNTEAKGLVMALKNASTSSTWSASGVTLGTDYQISAYKDTYNGTYAYNGYYLKKEMDKQTSSTFVAANAAATYSEATAPKNTSGWYLPSSGEWMLMLGSDGIGGCTAVENNVIAGSSNNTGSNSLSTITSALDYYLNNVGEGNYDAFTNSSNTVYWSASESRSNGAWGVNFNTTNTYVYWSIYDKTLNYYVRSVLAF